MALGRLLACAFLALSLGSSAAAGEQEPPASSEVQSEARIASDDAAPKQEPAAEPQVQSVLPAGLAPELEQRLTATGRLTNAERADREALKQFYAERQNDPMWTTQTGYTAAAEAARAEIARADDWGLQASAYRIPALSAGRELTRDERADAEVALSLAILQYARHARGGRTDPISLSRNLDRQPPLLDPRTVIEAAATTSAPDAYLRSLHPQHPQFERLRRLYLVAKHTDPREDDVSTGKGKGAKKRASSQSGPTPEKILVNMEQWRWMPEHMGRFYVWVNIPEYVVRVIKDGREIHSERVVVGRTTTPTPIFSDEMQHIIFHPFWNVPDSIKNNELLPNLQAGDLNVLSRQNLRIALRGRDIDPGTVDWGRADMRKYHVYQPPGGGNALGIVKFLFPNKHDVYLHDTPSKGLFESHTRAYSHGCIRVRHPLKLAEVLLGEDQGWSSSRVAMTAQRGPQDNQVNLHAKMPVHLTYFTMWVDDDGRVRTFSDVYDHEHRIAYGLAGKPHLIRREPEPPPPAVVQVRRAPRWTATTEPSSGSRRSYGYGSTGSRSSGSSRGVSSGSDTDWIRRVFQY